MLPWQLPAHSCYIGIHSFRLLFREGWQVIPVSLKRVCNLVGGLGVAKLEDGVVVEGPVLRLFVLSLLMHWLDAHALNIHLTYPDLLALNAKDLHADSSWRWNVVGNKLRREGRVSHDNIITSRPFEHALSKMWRQFWHVEFAHHALVLGQHSLQTLSDIHSRLGS